MPFLIEGRASFCNLLCFTRTPHGKVTGLFKPPRLWVSSPKPTDVKHFNGTCHHTHVLPWLLTTRRDYKNRMLCRRFRECSRAKVWKIQIPGRPNY
jgi:hypothetical protein